LALFLHIFFRKYERNTDDVMAILAFSQFDKRIPDEQMEDMMQAFSYREKLHVLQHTSWPERQRCLMGRLLLRRVLQDEFGIDNIRIEQDTYGRPYAAGFSSLDFNISHSGCWIGCAVSSRGRIGFDLEEMRNVDYSICPEIFTNEEINWLETVNSDERKKRFFKLWTLKESFVKSQGSTLLIHFNGTDSPEFFQNNMITSFLWRFRVFQSVSGYTAAVCLGQRELISTAAFYSLPGISRDGASQEWKFTSIVTEENLFFRRL
jgi:4'-phosphopantetheinyl transferase